MSVLIAPLIIGIIFIILIIAAPFIFRAIFKIENCFGYCSGLCCFIVELLVLAVIFIAELFALGAYSKKNNLNFNVNSISDINYLMQLSFGIRFVIWLVFAIFKVVSFLIIFCFVGKISSPEHKCNVVFMFISGYILLYIFYYLFMILMSTLTDILAKYFEGEYDGTVVNGIEAALLIYLELYGLVNICLYVGAIIMVFLYKKKLSDILIWICVACFFGPSIIEFIGLCGVRVFYSYLAKLSYLCSLVFGIIFYCKLANNNVELPNSDTQLLAMDNRI